jgi:hypothetical protein
LKALSSPQFNWYNKWTSLGPNGLPVQEIKDSLKQPNFIKISLTTGGKEMTGSTLPNQACFSPEFSLLQMLPDFKAKFVSC